MKKHKGRFSSEERKKFCEEKYNGKYSYEKSDFSKSAVKTIVTCPEHGDFFVSYDKHFNSGVGCKYCSGPSRDIESFVREAKKIHGNKYSYKKSVYVNAHEPLVITCPVHGDFEQSPNAHLRGQGCPTCGKGKSALEERIEKLLIKEGINFEKQKKEDWLKRSAKNAMSLDFYLPDYNLAIECQGKQHFGLGGWSNSYDFNVQKERDEWKYNQCKEHGVNIVYFAKKYEAPKEYIGTIFTNEKDLLNYLIYLLKNNF